MKYLKRTIQAVACCTGRLISQQAVAQYPERQVICTTGMPFATSDKSVDWCVGEPMVYYHWTTNDSLFINEGFEQPPMVYRARVPEKDPLIIYPNPAYGAYTNVTLSYTIDTTTDASSRPTHVDVRVLNLNGQLVFTDGQDLVVTNPQFTYVLDVSKYYTGIYMISLIFDKGVNATKKLLKL